MVLMIVAVSVHDAILVLLNHKVIRDDEMNPIGRWLIEQQSGDVWLFVLSKLCGTAIVAAVLASLHRRRRRLAFVVAGALTCFQIGLLLFLSLR